MVTPSRSPEVAESDGEGHRVVPTDVGSRAWWSPIRLAFGERDEAVRPRVLLPEGSRAWWRPVSLPEGREAG
jgi:hypothetical protein